MSKKYTIEIDDIPVGKEIDFEKSTLTNIVFKDIKPIIKWNDMCDGVEINADGEHFVIDAKNPTAVCNWYKAKRYASEPNYNWKLPTIKQVKVIAKYFKDIDNVITNNNGYPLIKGWYWSCEEKDENCAWIVNSYCADIYDGNKCDYNYVRSVRPL